MHYQINRIRFIKLCKSVREKGKNLMFLLDQICRNRFFKTRTSSNFQIYLMRFKPINLKKAFEVI